MAKKLGKYSKGAAEAPKMHQKPPMGGSVKAMTERYHKDEMGGPGTATGKKVLLNVRRVAQRG